MIKPIFKALRQFLLSTLLRTSAPKLTALSEPEPKRSDLTPENDAWMFDTPRTLVAERADFGQALTALSGQLSNVRDVLSRISPTAPAPAPISASADLRGGAIWSDTMLFDGEPALIAAWGDGLLDGDMDFLFGDTGLIENDLASHDVFGGHGYVSTLAA